MVTQLMMAKSLGCYLCGKETLLEELKAYKSTNWICKDCSDRIFRKDYKKPIRAMSKIEPQPQRLIQNREKQNYKCTSCRYEARLYNRNERCPHCSMEGSMARILSSDDVLN